MWSLGCILYSLLCGSSAFDNHNQEKMRTNILSGRFSMDPRGNKVWAVVTEEAKNLVTELLTVNPLARLSATEALRHSWFKLDPEITQRAENLMGEGRKRNTRRISSIAQGNIHTDIYVHNLYLKYSVS
jgi:serine/threonine protein kinase